MFPPAQLPSERPTMEPVPDSSITPKQAKKRKTKAVPEPEAPPRQYERDRYFEAPRGELPPEHLPNPEYVVVLEQGTDSASVGFAVAAMINYLRRERGDLRLVSQWMLYENAREFDEWGGASYEGSSLRGAMIGWWQHGACDIDEWPGPDMNRRPDYRERALLHKPVAFARVRATVEDLRAAVHHQHAVVVAADLHDGWHDVSSSMIEFDPAATVTGTHAFVVLGYNQSGFIVQNSWGQSWKRVALPEGELPGCAIWKYADASRTLQDAWVARVPGRIQARRRWQPGYRTDSIEGEIRRSDDSLGILNEVQALSAVAAAKSVDPPLSIGLFGDWGSGKSFFMRQMERHIEELDKSSKGDPTSAYCTGIVQIRFNAWHYLDTNLWASLVSQILDGLLGHVRKEETDEQKRARMEEELRAESEVLSTAHRSLEDAQRQEVAARDALRQRKQELAEARRTWKEVSDDIQLLFTNDVELLSQLDAAATEMGLESVPKTVSALRKDVAEAAKTSTQIQRAVGQVFRPEGRGARLVTMFLVGSVLVILWALTTEPVLNGLSILRAAVLEMLGAAGVIAAWSAATLRQILPGAKKLAALGQRIDELRVDRIEQRTVIERKEVEIKSQAVAAAAEKVASTGTRISQLQAGIARLDPSEQLREFIISRGGSSDYTKQLGIVSMVRKDFENLSGLLRRNQEAAARGVTDPEHPSIPVQRIILYIDDLDRCTPDRVVAVLEAVHLLLAFRLFVVVVAVDPRWLRRSLEKVYPDLLGSREEREVDDDPDWHSTPQDYLEKIFQIPLYLKPISKTGYQNLIGSLVGPDVSRPEALQGQGGDLTNGQADLPFPEGVGLGDLLTEEEPLDPDRLRFHQWEFEDMQRLALLFRTPRSVKRFVNTYRLVRALVRSNELAAFEGTAEEPGDYRQPMLLLGILSGFPNVGSRFLQRLEDTISERPDLAFSDFRVQQFAVAPAAGPPASTADAQGEIDAFSEEWERLGRALGRVETPAVVGQMAQWLPRVVRFGFVPGGSDRDEQPNTSPPNPARP